MKDTATIAARLSGTFDWTISFKDDSNQIVRTLTGHDSSISELWDGKDTLQNVPPDGVYTYAIRLSDPTTGAVGPPSSGTIQIDNTPPTVEVTSPRRGAILWGDEVPITGTTYDLNFVSYQLAFGQGEGPVQWTPFTSNSRSVEEGQLGNWQTVSLDNGPYTLRLLAVDRADNFRQTTVPVVVDNLKITEVSMVPRFFRPVTESTQIQFTLDRDAAVTVQIYSFIQIREDQPANRIINVNRGNVIRSINSGRLPAGPNVVAWDGRNDAGVLVPPDTYGVKIEALSEMGRRGMYDPPYVWGEVTRQNPRAESSFDPFRNIPLLIHYTLPLEGWVTLKAGVIGELIERARILWGVPRLRGNHTERWEGRTDNGSLLTRETFNQLSLDAILMPENSLVVYNPSLDISELTVDGFILLPTYRNVSTIVFQLTQDAQTTIRIFTPSGQLVRTLLDRAPKTAGLHEMEWDGRDDAGRLMRQSGSYRIELTAGSGSTQVTRQGTITLF